MLYRIPLSPSYIQKGSCLLLTFIIGMMLDLTSLIFLPLFTYIILSSTHIVFFLLFYIHDQLIEITTAEKSGILLIGLACFTVSIAGACQSEISGMTPDALFIVFSMTSLLISFAIKRLRFYNSKILLDACIPAQISVLSAGLLKMGAFVLKGSESEDFSIHFLYPLVLMLLVLTGMSSSLIRVFKKQHDIIVIYGGYQMWCLIWSVPVFIAFMNYFVIITSLDIAIYIIAFLSALIGIFMITYQRVENLKQALEEKNIVLPPRPSHFEQVPVTEQPDNISIPICTDLELNIEDDNLMDAEIIDEDLLIKTIRNF